ncbi:hypothetical protein HNR22_004930 [Micromonospora jinlongensis]|uniref:Uncharacterized protein n=1 Tax=Micromonospora jinlongensis TaxID=1287877 RepID=A0A7Y9X6Y4_9ACTN|nr:hypothetical protein [Micromonospora jinlongensis]
MPSSLAGLAAPGERRAEAGTGGTTFAGRDRGMLEA